jgi:hypothetical protein
MTTSGYRWPLLTVLLVAACAQPGTAPTPPQTGRSTPPSATPSPSSSAAPRKPRCVHGVEITAGETSAAMGLRATGIKLRNCGKKPYTVNGYPALDVLGEDRKKLDLRVGRGVSEVAMIEQWNVRPKRVTVAPGKSVTAVLVWRNLTTDAEKAATGAYLSVARADGEPRQTIACSVDAGNTGKVAVSPWVAPA